MGEHGYMGVGGTDAIHGIQCTTKSIMAKRLELCPVEATARIVGGRWKGVVLEQLFHGTKRFSELKRGIAGITQRTPPSNCANCRARESLSVLCTLTGRHEWCTPFLLWESR